MVEKGREIHQYFTLLTVVRRSGGLAAADGRHRLSFRRRINTRYTLVVTSSGTTQALKVGSDNWSVTDASRVTGTIGLRSYLADVYFDDVKVWKLVSSQPTISLGAEVARPIADKYYYGGSQRIGMRSGGVLTYIFADHLGGTSVTLNTTTGVTSTVNYYPFGGSRFSTGALPTDRLFTGQESDSSTGLYDYGARMYDASGMARFISPDSIVPQPGNPQSLNRYSYALGNPLMYVDPTGHYVMFVGGIGTDDSDESHQETWGYLIHELGLDQEGAEDYGFFDWSLGNTMGDGASTWGSLDRAVGSLSGQLEGKTDIKLIGHSKGGALVMEYLAQVAEGKVGANSQLQAGYSIDGALNPINSLVKNDFVGLRYEGPLPMGPHRRDRYANLPARLTQKSLDVKVVTFDNTEDWLFTTHDHIPGVTDSLMWAVMPPPSQNFYPDAAHGLLLQDPRVATYIGWGYFWNERWGRK